MNYLVSVSKFLIVSGARSGFHFAKKSEVIDLSILENYECEGKIIQLQKMNIAPLLNKLFVNEVTLTTHNLY